MEQQNNKQPQELSPVEPVSYEERLGLEVSDNAHEALPGLVYEPVSDWTAGGMLRAVVAIMNERAPDIVASMLRSQAARNADHPDTKEA